MSAILLAAGIPSLIGTGAFLVALYRLAKARTATTVQKTRADLAEERLMTACGQVEALTKMLAALKSEKAEDRTRLEAVVKDLHQNIADLNKLLAECQDPKVVHERLKRLGSIVNILK
jgi:hypothetical protein